MSAINDELLNALVLKSHNELDGLSLNDIMKAINDMVVQIHLIFNESERKELENKEYQTKLNRLNTEVQEQSI